MGETAGSAAGAATPTPSEPGPTPDWERLATLAYRSARLILHEHHGSMDVAQEAMAALWAIRECPPGNVDAWVTRVAQNRAKNKLRTQSRERDAMGRVDAIPPAAKNDECDEVLGRIVMDTWLERLPARERLAVKLRLVADLDRITIAELMQVSPETVKTMLKRGRAKLRDERRTIFEGTREN